MRLEEHVLKTAFLILDLCKIDAENLMLWQKSWEQEFKEDGYVPRFETEKLVYNDLIQKNFVDNGRGTGRLAWKRAKYFTCLCGEWYNFRIFLSCFTGPTSSEVSEIVASVCDYYQSFVDNTPWEKRYFEAEYANSLERMKNKQPILNELIPNLRPIWWCYHRLKVRKSALITVIAALRYKAEHGHYPETLDVLLKHNYLSKLPQDPFSEGHLVYHLLDDDFELYSIEKDFRDDGGGRFPGGSPISGIPEGDEVFWPPLSKGRKNIKLYEFTEKQPSDK